LFASNLYLSRKYRNCYNIVEIFNGLGNQFFSYSFGYILEKETRQRVCYDLSFFNKKNNNRNIDNKKENHEILMLNKFNVDLSNSIFFNESLQMQQRLFRKFRKIGWIDNSFRFHVIEDNIFNQDRKIFEGNYFSKKYYYKYEKDLLKFFSLKVALNKKKSEDVRRN
jgi:hypothetical protein